jgi:hypothetical protein
MSQVKRRSNMSTRRRPGCSRALNSDKEDMIITRINHQKQVSNGWRAQKPVGFDELPKGGELILAPNLRIASRLVCAGYRSVALPCLFCYVNGEVNGSKAKVPINGLAEAIEGSKPMRITFALGFKNCINIDLSRSATFLSEYVRDKGITVGISIGDLDVSKLDAEGVQQLLLGRVGVMHGEGVGELAERILGPFRAILGNVGEERRREIISKARKQISRAKRYPAFRKALLELVHSKVVDSPAGSPKAFQSQSDLQAAILLVSRAFSGIGLKVISSVRLSDALVEVLRVPANEVTPKILARSLAPCLIRPSAVSVGISHRCQGYVIDDLVRGISAGWMG